MDGTSTINTIHKGEKICDKELHFAIIAVTIINCIGNNFENFNAVATRSHF